MNVIVTGSLGYDYIMDFSGRFSDRIMADKIHKISLSFLANKFNRNFGGTAGNIAYTLKLLDLEPIILAPAGNDFSLYKEHLKKHHISTDFVVEHKDESTGTYFCVTDQEDNQIGAFYAGATKYAKELSIKRIPPLRLRGGKGELRRNMSFIVLAPTDSRAMIKYAKECQELNLPYLFDPAFQIGDFSKEELNDGISHAEILIGNDYEIALIEKKLGVTHAQLMKLVPVLITTLGSKGSVIESALQHDEPVIYSSSEPQRVEKLSLRKFSTSSNNMKNSKLYDKIKINPAKPQNTSDPTGAGDAYRAGFLAGYLRGFDLKTSGQMGSVAAAYTVEKYGTQTHRFTKKEFAKRYKENFGKKLVLDKLER